VHKCRKIEPFFHYHFHTCETFLINIPQYGLYNFSYSDNPDNALISVVVENAIQVRTTLNDRLFFIFSLSTRLILLFVMKKILISHKE
jgi:hypothetical protein